VSTVQENQSTVKIHILQGESDDSKQNVSLGQFELHNIQPGARGEPRIQVHFNIDSSGIVRVSAEDSRSGVSDEIEIASPIGMTEQELEEIQANLDGSGGNSDLDALKDDVNIHISSIEAKLITKGDQMDPAIVESIKNTVAKARSTLENGDTSDLEAAISSLEDHAALFPA
jgi:molecular chaperone DnaK